LFIITDKARAKGAGRFVEGVGVVDDNFLRLVSNAGTDVEVRVAQGRVQIMS
jgi:hypothetical protein